MIISWLYEVILHCVQYHEILHANFLQSSKGNITLLYNKVPLCYYFFVMFISIYYTIMMVILLPKLRKVFYEKLCCLFTLRKTNTSRLPHSKNCNKFSMRKCVVCSHWEKQTLQGFPILKIVINLAWENVLSVDTEKNKHFKVTPF